jgi:immune inhibitor A
MRFVSLVAIWFFLMLSMATQSLRSDASLRLPQPPPVPGSHDYHLSTRQPQLPHSIPAPMPRMGDQKLLVVLADFPDLPGTIPGAQWKQFFFGASNSFAAYYKEVSYNQLRYSGDIVGIASGSPAVNSDAVAYVRLPNPITYYADGLYGYKVGAAQFPKNNAGVVVHAVQALETAGFDFTPYANPTTKVLDNLVVIFAGQVFAYSQDKDRTLQATGYAIALSRGTVHTTTNGITVNNFTFCHELNGPAAIAKLGICAHEHGHSLGMPDLYDFSFTTTGVGNFDLMSYGTYGFNQGVSPQHFGAFSKGFLQWLTFTLPLSGTSVMELQPAETHSNVIKLVPNGNTSSKEYFLLENRQPLGFDSDFDGTGQSLKLCRGLVIWHVDENIISTQILPNLVNTLPSAGGPPHQGVVIVEADGDQRMITPPLNSASYGVCGDTWAVGRSWNDSTLPNAKLWDGSNSGLQVTVMSQISNTLTLSITAQGGAPPPILDKAVFLPLLRK